jgi:hypothetical protein
MELLHEALKGRRMAPDMKIVRAAAMLAAENYMRGINAGALPLLRDTIKHAAECKGVTGYAVQSYLMGVGARTLADSVEIAEDVSRTAAAYGKDPT